jgi:hypothetical protein
MPGAQCTRGLVCKVESTRVRNHRSTGITRHSRTRMVLTVSFVLSPVIGLSCHRRKRNAQALSPLDASVEASGPHDFTVRESRALVSRTGRVHRISFPTSVTIASAPLSGNETAGMYC